MAHGGTGSTGGTESNVMMQPATLDPAFLEREELEHELIIRELLRGSETDLDKSDQEIRKMFETNANNEVTVRGMNEVDPRDEALVLKAKVFELQSVCYEEVEARTRMKQKARAPSRLISLYLHTLFRIRRSMFRDPLLIEDFQLLVRDMSGVYRRLISFYPELLFPKLYDGEDDEDPRQYSRKVRSEVHRPVDQFERGSRSSHKSADSDRQSECSSHASRRSRRSSHKAESETEKKNKEHRHKKEPEPEQKYKERRHKAKKRSKDKPEPSKSDYRQPKGYTSDTSSSGSATPSRSPSPAPRRSSRRTLNPVARWSLRLKKGDDLQSFLEDVEEAVDINCVTEDELLRGISGLLHEEAKRWYRQKKGIIGSWDAFKREIKLALTPGDDDEEILEKINNLQQGKDETFALFEARCEELCSRLKEPLTKAGKLKKMLKGLHLYFRSRIRAADMDSLNTLRSECAKLEQDKAQISKKEAEERRRQLKREGKEDSRDSRRYTKVAAVEVEEDVQELDEEIEVAAVTAGQSALVCWRCGGPGHYSIHCRTSIFCIQCGAKDTIAERCRNCAKNSTKWSTLTTSTQPAKPGNTNTTASAANSGQSFPAGGTQGGVNVSPFSVPPPVVAKKQTNTQPQQQQQQQQQKKA